MNWVRSMAFILRFIRNQALPQRETEVKLHFLVLELYYYLLTAWLIGELLVDQPLSCVGLVEYFLRTCYLIWFVHVLTSDLVRGGQKLPRFDPMKSHRRYLRRCGYRFRVSTPCLHQPLKGVDRYLDGFANTMSLKELIEIAKPKLIQMGLLSYSSDFQRACDLNHQFIDLFGLNHIGQLKQKRSYAYYAGLDQELLPNDPGDIVQEEDNFIRFKALYTDKRTTDYPIIFDTGASLNLTSERKDFIDYQPIEGHIDGINSTAGVEGIGTVRWKIKDDNGKVHYIKCQAKHVPSAKVRLFSPQVYLRGKKQGYFLVNGEHGVFAFPEGGQLTFTFNEHYRLPVGQGLTVVPKELNDYCTDIAMNGVLHEDNINLTNPQKELLRWHFKLIHINMTWVQSLMKPRGDVDPLIKTKFKTTPTCDKPKCASCMFSKAHRLPTGATTTRSKDKAGIKAEFMRPGELVHTDQFISQLKGRLAHTKGKEKSKDKYKLSLLTMLQHLCFVSNQVNTNHQCS